MKIFEIVIESVIAAFAIIIGLIVIIKHKYNWLCGFDNDICKEDQKRYSFWMGLDVLLMGVSLALMPIINSFAFPVGYWVALILVFVFLIIMVILEIIFNNELGKKEDN